MELRHRAYDKDNYSKNISFMNVKKYEFVTSNLKINLQLLNSVST